MAYARNRTRDLPLKTGVHYQLRQTVWLFLKEGHRSSYFMCDVLSVTDPHGHNIGKKYLNKKWLITGLKLKSE